MNTSCQVCGGSGVIRCADVYRDQRSGKATAIWELGKVIACGCRYKEAA